MGSKVWSSLQSNERLEDISKINLIEVFGTGAQEDKQEALIASLYEKIGRFEIQLDWLKKTAFFNK